MVFNERFIFCFLKLWIKELLERGSVVILHCMEPEAEEDALSPEPRHRSICTNCDRPTRVCLCHALPLPPIQTATRILIVQHPHEARHKLSTTPILNKSLLRASSVTSRRLRRGSPQSSTALPPRSTSSPPPSNNKNENSLREGWRKPEFVWCWKEQDREGMAVRQRAASALPTLLRTLRKEPLKPHSHVNALPSLRRAFSLYDQINLIDQVPEDQLRFQGYNDTGFTVNGVEYEGSLLCVGNLLMSWKPKKFSEITADSLSLFKVIRPIPEILILGCGRDIQHVDPELRQFIRSTGVKLEAVDSRNAASTYNILNEEGRIVAAALLPHGVSS